MEPNPKIRREDTLPLLAIVLVLVAIWQHVVTTGIGWDFRTYVAAVEVFWSGGNPYDIAVLQQYGGNYPFIYLPVTVFILVLITSPTTFLPTNVAYVGLYAVALIASGRLLRDMIPPAVFERYGVRRLWVTGVLVAGFQGVYWSVISGNLDILGLLLLTGAMWYASEQKYGLGGVLLGVLSLLKLFPVVLIGVFLLDDGPLRRRLEGMAGMILTILVGAGISRVFWPSLFPEVWLRAVRAESPPLVGQGYLHTLSTAYIFQDIAISFGLSRITGVVAYGLVLLIAGGIGAVWIYRQPDLRSRIALGAALMLLVLPRVKPYYMVYALPAVLLFSLHLTRPPTRLSIRASWFLCVLGVPIVAMLAFSFLGRTAVRDFHPAILFVLRYAPLLGLWGWTLLVGFTQIRSPSWDDWFSRWGQ